VKEPYVREWDETNGGNLSPFGIHKRNDGHSERGGNYPMPATGANKRSVWTVTTKPYPGSHYAVFPPDLIEPCVLAGCPEGGLVLDPFVGSGTTLMVARKHRRNAIGLDLNFDYLTTNARERLQYGSFVPVADGITQLTIGGV
jgi:DNA modification methylase